MESIPGHDSAFHIFSPECTNYPDLRVRAGVRRLVGPPRCPRVGPAGRATGAGSSRAETHTARGRPMTYYVADASTTHGPAAIETDSSLAAAVADMLGLRPEDESDVRIADGRGRV